MSSTFTGLQIGKSGLFSAMSGLQVTGNNISNVNSKGYTRQKVDTIALGSYNASMRYCTDPSNYKGLGTRIMGTSQYRDPSLDVRYRQEAAKLSENSSIGLGLNEISSVFDDAINTELDSQISEIIKGLQAYASDPSNMVSENVVKTSCEVLTQFFSQNADKLDTAYGDMTMELNDAVKSINSALERIANLNLSIKSAEIGKYDALELKDERNMLIDELSQYMNIEVSTKAIPVGSGYSVEGISINFVDASGKKHLLVDDKDFNLISSKAEYANFEISITDQKGKEIENITENLQNGVLKGYLDILNGNGTFAADKGNSYKGIPFYQSTLDNLANKFAEVMNATNGDKPLFEANANDVNAKITASNIKISEAWKNSKGHYIKNSANADDTTDNSNILYMISQINAKHKFETGGASSYEGSFQDYLTATCSNLGIQIRANDELIKTHKLNLDDIEYSRQSVSGVSLDEEAVNMITYNYALTAASRFLTTVDDALGTLITNTGMVGR